MLVDRCHSYAGADTCPNANPHNRPDADADADPDGRADAYADANSSPDGGPDADPNPSAPCCTHRGEDGRSHAPGNMSGGFRRVLLRLQGELDGG